MLIGRRLLRLGSEVVTVSAGGRATRSVPPRAALDPWRASSVVPLRDLAGRLAEAGSMRLVVLLRECARATAPTSAAVSKDPGDLERDHEVAGQHLRRRRIRPMSLMAAAFGPSGCVRPAVRVSRPAFRVVDPPGGRFVVGTPSCPLIRTIQHEQEPERGPRRAGGRSRTSPS